MIRHLFFGTVKDNGNIFHHTKIQILSQKCDKNEHLKTHRAYLVSKSSHTVQGKSTKIWSGLFQSGNV